VGPQFATTRRPTRPDEITTQAGPKFATKTGQTGASSGDHTHSDARYERACPHGYPVTAAGLAVTTASQDHQAAGENTMGLPASEQRVLDTIENDLRITDRQLTAAFAAFTRFASGARTPRPERLSAWHRLITCLRSWRIGWLHLTAAGPGRSHPNAGR
jgi:hypothetical protein